MPETMTRDQILSRFRSERAVFDMKVATVPLDKLATVVEGHAHSVRDVVVHVSAYEALIVERLQAARREETTDLDRDRKGWEAFNERVWQRASSVAPQQAISEAAEVFAELMSQVAQLTDDELRTVTGVTAFIDPAWLNEHTLAEMLAIDGFNHYPMHYAQLDAAVV